MEWDGDSFSLPSRQFLNGRVNLVKLSEEIGQRRPSSLPPILLGGMMSDGLVVSTLLFPLCGEALVVPCRPSFLSSRQEGVCLDYEMIGNNKMENVEINKNGRNGMFEGCLA